MGKVRVLLDRVMRLAPMTVALQLEHRSIRADALPCCSMLSSARAGYQCRPVKP